VTGRIVTAAGLQIKERHQAIGLLSKMSRMATRSYTGGQAIAVLVVLILTHTDMFCTAEIKG